MSERASFSERGIDKYDNNGIGERGKPKVRIAAATTPTTNGLAVTVSKRTNLFTIKAIPNTIIRTRMTPI